MARKKLKCPCSIKNCLSDRCLVSLASKWNEPNFAEELCCLPKYVQIELMKSALSSAQKFRQEMNIFSRLHSAKKSSVENINQKNTFAEITVCGAGIGGVNGVYTLTGMKYGYRCYEKGAVVNGKETILCIRCAKMKGTKELFWWISSDFDQDPSGVIPSYYNCAFVEGADDPCPPRGHWSSSMYGKLPSPCITYSSNE
mmetsp:Transcript_2466/g.3610  ORF Transcript_2466/g.3610 Transcript_2466/m.3610 type:complete len:199 (-) Transcript_2466:87-683(-)